MPAEVDAAGAPLLIDSHGAPVAEAVWALYDFALSLTGPLPTLIERDNDLPEFPVLAAEARQAEVSHGAPRETRGRSMSAAFAHALLRPDASCPAGLKTWNGSDPAKRFAVYRNNVVVSLVDALADSFPVVQALVGEDFFRAMAAEFARGNPPRSPVLAWYGAGFADFVEGFPPAAGLPYLADVARLEWLRVEAWHAADADPLPLAEIGALLADETALPTLRLALHPSLRVLRSAHPVVSLWAAHQAEDTAAALGAIDFAEPRRRWFCARGSRWTSCASNPARRHSSPACCRAPPSARPRQAAGPFDLAATLGLLLRSGAVIGTTPARRIS